MQDSIIYEGMKVYFDVDDKNVHVRWIEVLKHCKYCRFLEKEKIKSDLHRYLEQSESFLGAVSGHLSVYPVEVRA